MAKIFISYSWDSEEHMAWVLMLAEQLEREPGLDIRLDRWHLSPGDSLTSYMEEIAAADFCVVVCTPKYAEKAAQRSAGVGYEAQIITAQVLSGNARRKFIPIIRSGDFFTSLPTFLADRLAIDFREDGEFAGAFEHLLRALLDRPLHVPPPKGVATRLDPALPSDRVAPGVAARSGPAPTISPTAARFGVALGYQLGRFEFICDSPFPEAHAIEQSSRDEIRQMLALENDPRLIEAANGGAREMMRTVLNHYYFSDLAKHAAVSAGIGAQRFGLVGSSSNEEHNAEMERIAYSAFEDIDVSIVPEKRKLAEAISGLERSVVADICEILLKFAVA